MNTDWKVFLTENGANFNDNIVNDFGNPQHEQQASVSGTVITDLSHLGIIQAHGPDAANFLQGQLTNDIRLVDDEHCQISGYCNPQGRLLAIFLIFQFQDSYYLLLPASLLPETLERLTKYTLMSKVTLADVSDDWVKMGIHGKRSGQQLQSILDTPLPTPATSTYSVDKLKLIYVPGLTPRYIIFGTPDDIKPVWNKLRAHSAAVGANNWGWHDIQAGIPVVYPETIGSFIPQMVNLDVLDAINFKKGCYTGQEIIARLHYRGKLKRRMYLAHLTQNGIDTSPQPGDVLYHEQHSNDEGKAIGHIVRCQQAPDGGTSLLAVIVSELAEEGLKNGQIHWHSPTGPALEFRQLPYNTKEIGN